LKPPVFCFVHYRITRAQEFLFGKNKGALTATEKKKKKNCHAGEFAQPIRPLRREVDRKEGVGNQSPSLALADAPGEKCAAKFFARLYIASNST
jgi:hypothetical protein